MPKKRRPGGDDAPLDYYAVLFVDLLGQRALLRQVDDIPTADPDGASAVKILSRTIGVVGYVRDLYRKAFRQNDRQALRFIRNAPTKEDETKLRRMFARTSMLRGFSDCLTVSIPVDDEDEYCSSVYSLYGVLIATCGIVLDNLARGQTIRGGMEIGIGVEISRGEIYGPALERAVSIESREAEYPRIVVGNRLVEFLTQLTKSHPRSVASAVAEDCLGFFSRDTDGKIILDVLGAAYRRNSPGARESVSSAYLFVVREQRRLLKTRNKKLANRYARLREYFESRVEIWGYSPTKTPSGRPTLRKKARWKSTDS